eukprot:gene12589-14557_t
MKKKNNIASVHPLDDLDKVDAKISTVMSEALVEEESKHHDLSSDDYSISSEEQHAPVSAVRPMSGVAQNRHRTRRESLNAGLNVLNTLRKTQMVMMPAQSEDNGSSEDSNNDEVTSDASSSGVEEETEEEEESEEEEEESSDGGSDDGDGPENAEEDGSSEIDCSDLESDSGNGIESECESASLIDAATAKRSGQHHKNASSADITSFSDAPSRLRAQELDGNLTQFSDELHMPLGTPLSSPHTVRRKQNGRLSATVMRIGEDGFSESGESSKRSSGSEVGSNERDTESEYEYVYVTESEGEEEESEYETQSESDCESEGNSCDEADSDINELAAAPATKQVDEVKDFESLSSLASRPYKTALSTAPESSQEPVPAAEARLR